MGNETALGFTKSGKTIILTVLVIIGLLLGWYAPIIAKLALHLPFIPSIKPIEWLASTDNEWVPIVGACIGAIAGIVFALYIFYEVLHITVTNDEVTLTAKNKTEIFRKEEISAIFFDGKKIVLLGASGIELYRGEPEAKKLTVKETFEQYGYPWADHDPYEAQYERWVPDHPDFPPSVNALLAARERALKNDEIEEAEALRKDLVSAGIIVRDEKKRQYVRRVEL